MDWSTGPQAVVEGKNVSNAAARGDGQERLTGERELRKNIKHAFQETGICSFEDRSRDHNARRRLDEGKRLGDLWICNICPQKRFGRQVPDRQKLGFEAFASQHAQYVLRHQRGARRRRWATRDSQYDLLCHERCSLLARSSS
jgi:hypothetical protein